MDIKKVTTREVFVLTKAVDYPAVQVEFAQELGDDNPFAKIQIGSGYFVWTAPDAGWRPLSEASELKASEVRHAIDRLRKQVEGKRGAKLADMLFTVPDDTFVFYREDGNGLRVLLTGWGFRKPVSRLGGRETATLRQKLKHPVTISFSYAGSRLPDHEFAISLKHQLRRERTGADGRYRYPDLRPGECYTFTDVKSGRTFPITVEEHRDYYDFDLTAYVQVCVSVVRDGQPAGGEAVMLVCEGEEQRLTTNADGRCEARMVLREGSDITASAGGEAKKLPAVPDGVDFSFSIVTPAEPEPEPEPMPEPQPEPESEPMPEPQPEPEPAPQPEPEPIVEPSPEGQQKDLPNPPAGRVRVVVRREGQPIEGHEVTVAYAGEEYVGTTSADGEWTVDVPEVDGSACTVVAGGCNPQQHTLAAGAETVFIFDVPVPEDDEPERMLRITVLDRSGNAMRNAVLTLRQGNLQPVGLVLDAEGTATTPKAVFAIGEKVEADVVCGATAYKGITFAIDDEEDEYVLQETVGRRKGGVWTIVLEVLSVAAVAYFVLFPAFAMFSDVLRTAIYG